MVPTSDLSAENTLKRQGGEHCLVFLRPISCFTIFRFDVHVSVVPSCLWIQRSNPTVESHGRILRANFKGESGGESRANPMNKSGRDP